MSRTGVEALRGDLAPSGYLDELPSTSCNSWTALLGISFVSGVFQSARCWPIGSSARRQGGKRCQGRCRAKWIGVGWAEMRRAMGNQPAGLGPLSVGVYPRAL